MRKLTLILLVLLLASPCFARSDVLSNVGTYGGSGQVTVGATAEKLGTTSGIISLYLMPDSNNTALIFVGDSSVTTGNGLALSSGHVVRLDISTVNNLYAVSYVASQKVDLLWIK